MEDGTIVPATDSEDIRDSFFCCVCLDLLYKPIVLSCGHIACFWCVYGSMSHLRESHCPICRHPYSHFPTICEMFHHLLLKLYPLTYKRREKQIMAINLSDQFDSHASVLIADRDCNHLRDSANSCTRTCESNSCLWPSSAKKDSNANVEQLVSTSMIQISIADVLCYACKQLLFRPVVLNCGHVYCDNCISNPVDQTIRCKICNSLHPTGFPKVCLELAEFLKEQFPTDYALRRDAVQQKQANVENKSQTTSPTKAGKGDPLSSVPARENLPWSADPNSHIGVGCDFCGMLPIVGDRYKCKDCEEAIGFDLCGDCYNTRSKRPGRFNQKHTPEHKFELVKPIPNIMLRLVTGLSEDVTPTFFLSDHAPEISENADLVAPEEHVPSTPFLSDDVEVSENEYLSFILSGEAPHSSSNGTHNDGIEDPDESQSPN